MRRRRRSRDRDRRSGRSPPRKRRRSRDRDHKSGGDRRVVDLEKDRKKLKETIESYKKAGGKHAKELSAAKKEIERLNKQILEKGIPTVLQKEIDEKFAKLEKEKAELQLECDVLNKANESLTTDAESMSKLSQMVIKIEDCQGLEVLQAIELLLEQRNEYKLKHSELANTEKKQHELNIQLEKLTEQRKFLDSEAEQLFVQLQQRQPNVKRNDFLTNFGCWKLTQIFSSLVACAPPSVPGTESYSAPPPPRNQSKSFSSNQYQTPHQNSGPRNQYSRNGPDIFPPNNAQWSQRNRAPAPPDKWNPSQRMPGAPILNLSKPPKKVATNRPVKIQKMSLKPKKQRRF